MRVGLVQSGDGTRSEKGSFPGGGGIQPQGRADLGSGSCRRLVSQSLNVTLSLLLMPWALSPAWGEGGLRGWGRVALCRPRPDLRSLRALAPRERPAGGQARCPLPHLGRSGPHGTAGSAELRRDPRGAGAGELGSRPCDPATGVSLGPLAPVISGCCSGLWGPLAGARQPLRDPPPRRGGLFPRRFGAALAQAPL